MRLLACSLVLVSIGAGGALVACSSAGGNNQGMGGSGAGGTGATGGIVITGGTGGGSAGFGGKLNQTPPCTKTDPNVDADGDGFTPGQGDCNDCSAQMNPGAYDYPGNGVDEDCNGIPDDEPTGCDTQTYDVGYGDPEVAARAIGICRKASATSWGLVSARYTTADGTGTPNDLSHGLLPNFGPNVATREGTNMLALSSGTARRPGDPGFASLSGADMGTTGNTPPGFPIDSPACTIQTANDTVANDPIGFEVVIKTPTNANELGFDFNFYTFEFPQFVCTQFNDFFVALVDPPPSNAQSGNVSFDSQGNPVSVNNGFVEVCQAQAAGGKNFPCALGTAQLQGTGFDEVHFAYGGPHAATSWLNTRAPVPPGQNITIRFAIWDMGDHILDSTVLIDNVTWDVGEGDVPITTPVPR
jgi:hypothetical protein